MNVDDLGVSGVWERDPGLGAGIAAPSPGNGRAETPVTSSGRLSNALSMHKNE